MTVPWEGCRYYVRATIAELVPEAVRLLRAATMVENAVLGISSDATPEPLRNAATVIQSGVLDVAVTLLGVAARAERLLFLTAQESLRDHGPFGATMAQGAENPRCIGNSRARCAETGAYP